MLRFTLYLVLFFSVLQGHSQKDTVRLYLDAEFQLSSKKDFTYPAMAIRQGDHWVLHAVYNDTTPVLQIYFADAALSVKDGPYILYYPKRRLAQKGSFKNNVADGLWQTWYTNGKLKTEGTLINNHFTGILKEWYENGQAKSEQSYVYNQPVNTGQPFHENSPAKRVQKLLVQVEADGVLEGPTATWYENGNKESDVTYHNDTLSGVCTWYRENGKPSSKETYTKGKITDLECYDEDGKYTGVTCSILKLPVLIHPMFTALDYIEYELHKDKNKDIRDEGEALVSFTVTKNGTVENLAVVRSDDPDLSRHIIQIFAKMPAWSPAVIHNRAVDYPTKLVIPYYRE